jgi:hypothetical protein
MATIITINAGDQITNSRSDLNTNFANLNSDKIETSFLDTDTALTANSDSKVATQKAVKAYVDAQQSFSISTETTTGTTHSLTTNGNQRVFVIVKGNTLDDGTGGNVTLSYNSVQKDIIAVKGANTQGQGFCLQYTETPASATQNITVASTGGVTIANVVIIVLKFNV